MSYIVQLYKVVIFFRIKLLTRIELQSYMYYIAELIIDRRNNIALIRIHEYFNVQFKRNYTLS